MGVANTSIVYDAIIIGSGMSGGWAAKELTEAGLNVLVIESGRDVKHIKDYPSTNMLPWEFPHRGRLPVDVKAQYKACFDHYILTEEHIHFIKKDEEQEYIQDKPFSWVRGDQVGGRSLLWGRQTQRLSDFDFEGPLRDGYAIDWPIRYKDLDPWYTRVEKFIGVAGKRDGIPQLPDGDFLPPFELTCIEDHFKQQMATHYPGRHVINARVANISQAQPIHLEQGRAQCQNRNLCSRGCPFGGYFSSNASTLPWAEKTGNLTMLTRTLVHSIIYDAQKQKATGVKVVNKDTMVMAEYKARIIFVNASTISTNLLLLNSTSSRFPNGLGNDNGLMGKYIGFHNFNGRVSAQYSGFADTTTDGRTPAGGFVPRFVNVQQQETDFLRGYHAMISSGRGTKSNGNEVGEPLKNSLLNPEPSGWYISAQIMGETILKETNHVYLDKEKKDKYGLPVLHVSVVYDDNDQKMLQHFFDSYTDMFTAAGYTNVETKVNNRNPGNENHEMGGVRMGNDPNTSLLNKWNQLHSCNNVFVTDGACMVSTGANNPSLTYMAMTARAANYAIEELKKRNL